MTTKQYNLAQIAQAIVNNTKLASELLALIEEEYLFMITHTTEINLIIPHKASMEAINDEITNDLACACEMQSNNLKSFSNGIIKIQNKDIELESFNLFYKDDNSNVETINAKLIEIN